MYRETECERDTRGEGNISGGGECGGTWQRDRKSRAIRGRDVDWGERGNNEG